jgi:hypothetical protein
MALKLLVLVKCFGTVRLINTFLKRAASDLQKRPEDETCVESRRPIELSQTVWREKTYARNWAIVRRYPHIHNEKS